jgi:hypothetical protein
MTRKPPAPIKKRLERATSDYKAAKDAADDMAARKSRSGTKWTEEEYRARGIELLHLRLKPEHHEPLDELCALWGCKRGEAAKRAIDEAHARHVAPFRRRGEALRPDEQSGTVPLELNKRTGTKESDPK